MESYKQFQNAKIRKKLNEMKLRWLAHDTFVDWQTIPLDTREQVVSDLHDNYLHEGGSELGKAYLTAIDVLENAAKYENINHLGEASDDIGWLISQLEECLKKSKAGEK